MRPVDAWVDEDAGLALVFFALPRPGVVQSLLGFAVDLKTESVVQEGLIELTAGAEGWSFEHVRG